MRVFGNACAVDVAVIDGSEIKIEQEDQYGGDPSVLVIPVDRIDDLVAALRQVQRDAMGA